MTDQENKNSQKNSPDTERIIEQRILPWRFWFSILVSAFLIVTFGWFLPMRFQYQGMTMGMHTAVNYEESKVTSGLAINLSVSPVPIMTGSSTRLDFLVNTKPGNNAVPLTALQYAHTKLMHVIGVRDDMNEFFHIHPAPTSTPGVLTTGYTFQKPGRYKIWSEITKDGMGYAFGHDALQVSGFGPESEKEVAFVKSVNISGYRVVLYDSEPIVKGENTEIAFDIFNASGNEAPLDPYLGLDMHLTIIKDDWKQFIHTHPDSGVRVFALVVPPLINEARADGMHAMTPSTLNSPPKSLHFHLVFPEAGLYKMFVQFRPAGIALPEDQALTATFWERVDATGPLRVSQFSLVMTSLILMSALGWIVKRMLVVKGL